MFKFSPDFATALIEQHRNELLIFLLHRVNCPETAADILQDAFFRLTQFESKSRINNPRAFLYKVAGNLAIDHLRSRSRQPIQELETLEPDRKEESEPLSLSAERAVMSQQQLEQLIAALSELSPKCREVFVLLKIKHCSYADVEKRLGISQTMIFKYLTQAMSHCRQYIGDFD